VAAKTTKNVLASRSKRAKVEETNRGNDV